MHTIHNDILSTNDSVYAKEIPSFLIMWLYAPPHKDVAKFLIIETKDNMYLVGRDAISDLEAGYKNLVVIDARRNRGRSLEDAQGIPVSRRTILADDGWIRCAAPFVYSESELPIRGITRLVQIYGDTLTEELARHPDIAESSYFRKFKALLAN